MFGIWVAHLWLGYLDGHIGYKFGELFGCQLESLSFGPWVRFLAYCGGKQAKQEVSPKRARLDQAVGLYYRKENLTF